MRKTKQVKQWAALIAAAAMIATILPGMALTAKAESGTVVERGKAGDNVTYKIFDKGDGSYHLEFTGSGEMYNFGSSQGTYDVWKAYKYYNKITSVGVGRGITRIGDFALYSLNNIQKIELCEGLLSLGEDALYHIENAYVRLPSTVQRIENFALFNYKGDITYPAGLQYIGYEIGQYTANKYYPLSAETWLANVGGAAKTMYEEWNIHFGSTDSQYGNYKEYEPWTEVPVNKKFVDVPSGSYYEDAVDWAVGKNITGGTDDTHFSPNNYCTRAQAMTFLWKACGSPTVSGSNRFVDVPAGSYYYSAVLWATQNGITSGTSSTTFGSNDYCTRAQIATFMYKANGSASVSASMRFTDVSSNAYYYNSVSWMIANNITGGTSATTFSPNNYCTRAQIVTFLYKQAQ